MNIENTISVFGLGKLGATMLACFAHKGWNVIGVDINQENVNKINQGMSPIYEPRVEDLIMANKECITATTYGAGAVMDSFASFIIVPTPSKPNGTFTTIYVEEAAKAIAKALKFKKTRHLVVVTSTVLPGDTERIGSLIEQLSGKKIGEDFGLCYNPDFIALGRIVHDFLNPDMILIGESDPASGEQLEAIHRHLVDNEPSIHRMSLENAELAKITLNAYCVMKINFANSIGEICEAMPTGDASKVLAAVGADSRVGNKYFKAGMPIGGPCFGRDSRAFNKTARNILGVKETYCYASVSDKINNHHTARIQEKVRGLLGKDGKLAVLGLSYKEDINVIEESAGVKIVKNLMGDFPVAVYDPAAMAPAKKEIGDSVTYAVSVEDCLKDATVCLLATPWTEFRNLPAKTFAGMKKALILDAWNLVEDQEGLEIVRIGVA